MPPQSSRSHLVNDALKDFTAKPPLDVFVSATSVQPNGDFLYAFRWPRTDFDGLTDFIEFTLRYESIIQYRVGQYFARDFDYYFHKNPCIKSVSENYSKSGADFIVDKNPRQGLDPIDWLSNEFPTIEIPWLQRTTRPKSIALTKEQSPFFFSMSDTGFLLIFCAKNEDAEEPEYAELPLVIPSLEPPRKRAGLGRIDQASKYFSKRIADQIGKETPIVYLAYPRNEDGEPVDNLDEIAVFDYVVIFAPALPESYGLDSLPFRSQLLDEPTWLELCEVLHTQIEFTRNGYQVVFKGIQQIGWTHQNGKPANEYILLLE